MTLSQAPGAVRPPRTLRPVTEDASPATVAYVRGIVCPEDASQLQRSLRLHLPVSRVHMNLTTGLLRVWGEAAPFEVARLVRGFGYHFQSVDSSMQSAANLPEVGVRDRVHGRERSRAASGSWRFWGQRVQGIFLIFGFLSFATGVTWHVLGTEWPEPWTDASVSLSTLAYVTAFILTVLHPLRIAFHSVLYSSPDTYAIVVATALGTALLSRWFEAALLTTLFCFGRLVESRWHHAMRRPHDASGALADRPHSGKGFKGMQIARFFTPAMVVAALLTAVLPPLIFGVALDRWVYTGLIVLLLSRPGVLTVAERTVFDNATNEAARDGIFLKNDQTWYGLASAEVIGFSQSGTLTEGHLTVVEIAVAEGIVPGDVLDVAAAILRETNHGAAPVLDETALAMERDVVVARNIVQHPGLGAEGYVQGGGYIVGNAALMRMKGIDLTPFASSLRETGSTGSMIVAEEGQALGVITLADSVRQGALRTIKRLKNLRGIRHVAMLTGEREPVARAVAEGLQLDAFHAELSPGEKIRIIESWKNEGHVTVMVGDGVADRGELSVADVGISLGRPREEVAEADVVMKSTETIQLPYLIVLARRAVRVAYSNLAWALFFKGAALGLLVSGVLTLSAAAALEVGSTLFVVMRARRVTRKIRITSRRR